MCGLYAIIRSGGKQLRVEPGQVVRLERLPGEPGGSVEFDEVLLIGGEGETRVGRPLLNGSKVRGTILAQGRNRKILVFKYKAKKNLRKRQGHRQPFTAVRIEAIEG